MAKTHILSAQNLAGKVITHARVNFVLQISGYHRIFRVCKTGYSLVWNILKCFIYSSFQMFGYKALLGYKYFYTKAMVTVIV